MSGFLVFKVYLLISTLMLALYHDVKEQKIKNYVTYSAAFLGLTSNVAEYGLDGLGSALLGWLTPVIVLGLFYIANIMGAGDIKLFAAIGAIMGLSFTMYSFAYSVYFGGLIALIILYKKKQFRQRMYRIYEYLYFVAATRKIAPYCAKSDNRSKFIFSAAIVPGTILHLFMTLNLNQSEYTIAKELVKWLTVF